MTCLHRYWFKEWAKYFAMIQVMILIVFVFIDYLSRVNNFLSADVSLLRGLWYVVLKLPFMFVQLTPASLLLAVIVAFGVMNRNGELTALKSSGISVYFLVKPALVAGGILSLVIFFMGETLIPVSMAKANHIRYHEMVSSPGLSQGQSDIWIKSGRQLVHINFFDPVNKKVAGLTATTMGKGFKVQERIDARQGRYDGEKWIFTGVIQQTYHAGNDDYLVQSLEVKTMALDLKPEDLGKMTVKTNEMSYGDLRRYVAKVTAEGYDATTYRVDMVGKLAFPFICVIMALTGAATGMRSFVKTNLPAAIGLGVVICFFYWFVFGFCVSLGYAKVLPALVAPWVANLIFLCLGTIYLINTE
jgi:lipopolysaccharide export system permease protein